MGDAHPAEIPKEGMVKYDRAKEIARFPRSKPFVWDPTPKPHDLKGHIIVDCAGCKAHAEDKPRAIHAAGWMLWGGKWRCGKCRGVSQASAIEVKA